MEMIGPLRIADLVDIALVAVLLYLFLWWVQQYLSESALRGVGLVLVFVLSLYLPARIFEMYMVEQISQLLFVFVLLASIVIFQSDLRRMLFSAGARLFGRPPTDDQSQASPVDVLVETAYHLSEASTGALIALRGRDPWDPYIQGGVELDGNVSPPLLDSLFDPHSSGHDGAVLLEGDRVTAFAAHLPLAETLPQESQYGGTRHAAALGLTEVCDAFVIVISEERGTISVAHEGNIRTLDSAAALKEALSSFWTEIYGRAGGPAKHWWSRRAFLTAVVSLAASVLLWFGVAYNPETVYRSYVVPIEYHDLPRNWAITDEASTAQITLSGPEQAFRMINPDQLAVSFSLKQPVEGVNELTVEESNLDLPAQLTLMDIEPRTIRVTLHPLAPVRLPVSVQTRGSVPDSLELVRIETTPDSVSLLAPQDRSYEQVNTEHLVLDSIRKETTIERALVPYERTRLPDRAPQRVKVHVVVRPKGH